MRPNIRHFRSICSQTETVCRVQIQVTEQRPRRTRCPVGLPSMGAIALMARGLSEAILSGLSEAVLSGLMFFWGSQTQWHSVAAKSSNSSSDTPTTVDVLGHLIFSRPAMGQFFAYISVSLRSHLHSSFTFPSASPSLSPTLYPNVFPSQPTHPACSCFDNP